MLSTKVVTIIAIIILFLVTLSAAYFVWLYRKPENFTRDRFAFAGLAVLASLSMALIETLSGPTLWDVVLAALRWAATGQFEFAQATIEGRFLMILCIIVVAYT